MTLILGLLLSSVKVVAVSRARLITCPYLTGFCSCFAPVKGPGSCLHPQRQELGSHTPPQCHQISPSPDCSHFHPPIHLKTSETLSRTIPKAPKTLLASTGALLTISLEIGDHVTSLIKIPIVIPFHRTNYQMELNTHASSGAGPCQTSGHRPVHCFPPILPLPQAVTFTVPGTSGHAPSPLRSFPKCCSLT